MNVDDLPQALKKLDALKTKKDTVNSWLNGDQGASEEYEQLRLQIETEFPGLQVFYVATVLFTGHALVPAE